jgi:6-phosphogluconolactonase (cycloisomerase 2 family)
MKFGKFGTVGKVALVCVLALAVATLFTACGSLTVGFLFVATTSQTPGQIEVYEINSETGGLRTIPTSPFPSGGRNPIAEAVSTDYKNLYVVNNDDNNITQFGIGTDGKLYSQSTINTPGTFPMALAVDQANPFLYVVDQLLPTAGCTQTNPCPGAIAGYAIQPTTNATDPGALGVGPSGCTGTACTNGNPVTNSNGLGYLPLQLSDNDTTILTPTAVAIAPSGAFVYVTAYNASTSQGYLFTFAIGSDGSLTPVPSGATYTFDSATVAQVPASLGTQPSGITIDPASAYAYVIDKAASRLTALSIQPSGLLKPVSTAATGAAPVSVTLSSTGYVYVANSLDGTVNGYSSSAGALATIGTYAAGNDPVAVIGDPRQLGFVYTVNFLGNSLSGFQVNANTGALVNAQYTPYASSTQPAAIAGIPHAGSTH